MKYVELIKGVPSSVLGFGCAPILGAVDSKSTKLALDYALDNGINHLDLARSYGYGEAEKFVGKIIEGKRQQMVIASKFGIQANWKASLLKYAKPLIRNFRNTVKSDKLAIANPINISSKSNIGNMFLDRIVPLRGKDMQKSLEKSLKELNTDYIDYFFIHEPYEKLIYIDELQETANKLKAEGKIRAWGLAYMQQQKELHQLYIDKFDLQQFNNSPGIKDYDELVLARSNKPNIFFSPLRGGTNDLKPIEKIKTLFNDFPNSVILCTMFNLEHIKQNMKIVK